MSRIQEAIEHCTDIINNSSECSECRKEHEELRDWLVLCSKFLYLDSVDVKGSDDGMMTATIQLKNMSAESAVALKVGLEKLVGRALDEMVTTEEKLTNKERVEKYCREIQCNSTDWLIERDDIASRIKDYPKDKESYWCGCPYSWGLDEFDGLGLCETLQGNKVFHSKDAKASLGLCCKCWDLALTDAFEGRYRAYCIKDYVPANPNTVEAYENRYIDNIKKGKFYNIRSITKDYAVLYNDEISFTISKKFLVRYFLYSPSMSDDELEHFIERNMPKNPNRGILLGE